MSSEDQREDVREGDGLFSRFQAYARTRKGMVLLGEALLCLIVFICFCSSVYGGYSAAPIIELVLSVIFFIVYMNHFDKTLSAIHWPCTDFFRCVIAVVVFAVISIIALTSHEGARIAAGVFGLFAGALFGYDAYLLFPKIKGSQHAPAPTDSENT
ncbi:proteolipid protein 2-like [Stegostoma tigrinum]|uniref:proteolipid protein 2-like n=1 Tax=Stegostoma tigrinum TaxID=3053191 RepID=UPI0028705044|nr:proteolipid protein 2-like [Stegostoma tigrinum]